MTKSKRVVPLCLAAALTTGAAATVAFGTAGIAAGASSNQLIHGTPQISVQHVNGQQRGKASAKDATEGAHFVSTAPYRSFDTRTGGNGPLHGGTALYLTYPKGTLDPRVTAIVFNMTVTNTTAPTYVTAWSGEGALPVASNMNLGKGETRANQVTVPIGHRPDGSETIAIYNNAGTADIIADIAGAYGIGTPDEGQKFTGYQPTQPTRVLDTTTRTPIPGGGTVKLDLSKSVPADTDSVTVNLTAVAHGAGGFLTLYPGDARRPGVSSINYAAKETVANQVTVQLGADKTLSLYNSAGSTDALIDVAGLYQESATALYYPTDSARVLDTRDGSGSDPSKGKLGPAETASVHLPDAEANAVAVNGNLTGTNGSTYTYLTTWPTGDRPNASNLNLVPGQTLSNADSAGLDAGELELYNNAGSTDVVFDVSGYFATPPAE